MDYARWTLALVTDSAGVRMVRAAASATGARRRPAGCKPDIRRRRWRVAHAASICGSGAARRNRGPSERTKSPCACDCSRLYRFASGRAGSSTTRTLRTLAVELGLGRVGLGLAFFVRRARRASRTVRYGRGNDGVGRSHRRNGAADRRELWVIHWCGCRFWADNGCGCRSWRKRSDGRPMMVDDCAYSESLDIRRAGCRGPDRLDLYAGGELSGHRPAAGAGSPITIASPASRRGSSWRGRSTVAGASAAGCWGRRARRSGWTWTVRRSRCITPTFSAPNWC